MSFSRGYPSTGCQEAAPSQTEGAINSKQSLNEREPRRFGQELQGQQSGERPNTVRGTGERGISFCDTNSHSKEGLGSSCNGSEAMMDDSVMSQQSDADSCYRSSNGSEDHNIMSILFHLADDSRNEEDDLAESLDASTHHQEEAFTGSPAKNSVPVPKGPIDTEITSEGDCSFARNLEQANLSFIEEGLLGKRPVKRTKKNGKKRARKAGRSTDESKRSLISSPNSNKSTKASSQEQTSDVEMSEPAETATSSLSK